MSACAGTAADQLLAAARLARKCVLGAGSHVPAWKLLGDILLQFHAVSPSPQAAPAQGSDAAQTHLKR